MVTIKKGKEPTSLVEAKAKGAKKYPDDLSKDEIDDLRKRLLQDQGYICCYCQNRIKYNEDGGTQKTKIEHFECRSKDSTYQKHLLYSNLFIACMGNKDDKEKESTCDTKKANEDIKGFNLLDESLNAKIIYAKNGSITSIDPVIKIEINTVLHLNEQYLRQAREEVYFRIHNIKKRLERKGRFDVDIKKEIEKWESRDGNNQFQSYYGVALYHLKRK